MILDRLRTCTALTFLGIFILGAAYIAILPPFEGFDENAHFSRVREVSNLPQSALNAESFIDRAVVDYTGPMPYSSGRPPYNLGNTYPIFFSDDEVVISFLRHYQKEPFDREFMPSTKQNWQIQHPPLYYLLMTPVINSLGNFSFLMQLMILRLCSFFISIAGLFLGYLAFKNILIHRGTSDSPLVGFIFYPIIFPMFFMEFARVGNDSLCLFIIGAVSYYLSIWLKNKCDYKKLVVIGVLLGLGLLTKAFFIPITVGTLFFLTFQHLYGNDTNNDFRHLLNNFQCILIPVILIGGSWYLFKFFTHGDLGIGGEASELVSGVGVLNGLTHNFNLPLFIRGLLVPFVSFSWGGTWSLVRFPIIVQLPMLFVGAWIFWVYIQKLKLSAMAHYESLALIMFSLLYLGLAVHVLISMALSGLGASGGWYLHILSPWLAPAVGMVINSIMRNKFKRLIFFVLVIYSLTFQWAVIWSHMALFSGCAVKDSDKGFLFLYSDICLDNYFVIFNRLQTISSPFVSIFLFALGFCLLISAVLRVRKIEVQY